MAFDPHANLPGGFSTNDGTIDFYLRVQSLLTDNSRVLDLGAGRASWFEDDPVEVRRQTRLMTGRNRQVIAADIDAAVLQNRASDSQVVIAPGEMGVEPGTADVIVADYVLEHVEAPDAFASSIHKALKPGGWFAGRTPHSWNYVSIAARLVQNRQHASALKSIQPDRKEMDVFPTFYRMNTLSAIRDAFPDWHNQSFVFRTDPSYFLGRSSVYYLQNVLHKIMPASLCGNLFVFLRKPE